jgi:tRNA-splicing ligase RtcB
MGIPPACAELAKRLLQRAQQEHRGLLDVLAEIERVAKEPGAFREHPFWGPLAVALEEQATALRGYVPRETEAPFRVFGEGLEPTALQQLRNACRLPVSVAGALMPDAHQGYGLPIGGVLATREAVIPYAVGVDIACRMKLSVLDLGPEALSTDQKRLARALEAETRFGVGAEFEQRRQHAVMDADWGVTRITSEVKDRCMGPCASTSRTTTTSPGARSTSSRMGPRPR